MMNSNRIYLCTELQDFYACVECADRGLDPFTENLIVADTGTGNAAVCISVTPHIRKYGIRELSPLSAVPQYLSYKSVLPRGNFYINKSADIYAIFLKYFSPEDIYVYSLSRIFTDITDYLKLYNCDARTLSVKLMREIYSSLYIPSFTGTGTNLYLALTALEMTARYRKDRTAFLCEESYRGTLWDHTPLTDFRFITNDIAIVLAEHGIFTMRELATSEHELIYELFGDTAELLIDHAWGREYCTITDIKNCTKKTYPVSISVILPTAQGYTEGLEILKKLAVSGAEKLASQKLAASVIDLGIGYNGERYPPSKAEVRMDIPGCDAAVIRYYAEQLYTDTAIKGRLIKRIGLNFSELTDNYGNTNMITGINTVEQEKKREKTVLQLINKYGKGQIIN